MQSRSNASYFDPGTHIQVNLEDIFQQRNGYMKFLQSQNKRKPEVRQFPEKHQWEYRVTEKWQALLQAPDELRIKESAMLITLQWFNVIVQRIFDQIQSWVIDRRLKVVQDRSLHLQHSNCQLSWELAQLHRVFNIDVALSENFSPQSIS